MKRHWWMAGLTVLVMLLGLPMGATQAQAPVPGGGLEAGDAQAIITGGSLTYSFTYQGYLERDGGPANGNFDFIITIWDTGAAGMGTQIATCSDPSSSLINHPVVNGFFSFHLIPNISLANVFNGNERWVQVQVRPASTGAYTTLPRQPVAGAPYAWGLQPGLTVESLYSGSLVTLKNTYSTGTTAGSALVAHSQAPTVPTIHGWHKGDGPAIYGYTSGAYPAVEGMHGGEGPAVGGYGSSTGSGVYGSTSSNSWPGDAGVFGRSTGRAPAVHGENTGASPNNGPGVYGQSSAGAGGQFQGGFAGIFAIASGTGSRYAGGFYNSTNASSTQYDATIWMENTGSGDLIWANGNSAVDGDVDFRVSANGYVYADGTYSSPAADFAELLPAVEGLEPGDVLVIGLDGKLVRSSMAFDTAVLGVYSTQPGFLGGADASIGYGDKAPLAVVGIVLVKASATNGAIRPGDLLVTSEVPGHAMHAGANPPVGTVIGKALETLPEGEGVIRMLVTLQ